MNTISQSMKSRCVQYCTIWKNFQYFDSFEQLICWGHTQGLFFKAEILNFFKSPPAAKGNAKGKKGKKARNSLLHYHVDSIVLPKKKASRLVGLFVSSQLHVTWIV